MGKQEIIDRIKKILSGDSPNSKLFIIGEGEGERLIRITPPPYVDPYAEKLQRKFIEEADKRYVKIK